MGRHLTEIDKNLFVIPVAGTCPVIPCMRYGACAAILVVVEDEIILTLGLTVLMQQKC
ncbi:hypothetical protein D3C73_1564860 [compost metagenome]